MRKLPIQSIMEATVVLLKSVQDTPIYEYVDGNVKSLPYITFGVVEATPDGTKTEYISNASMELEVYSNKRTRTEPNSILSDLLTIFNAVRLDLSAYGFAVMSQSVESVTSNPTDSDGYTGLIRINFVIQEM